MAHSTFQKSIENKGISQGNNRFLDPQQVVTLTYNTSFESLESEHPESGYNLEMKLYNLSLILWEQISYHWVIVKAYRWANHCFNNWFKILNILVLSNSEALCIQVDIHVIIFQLMEVGTGGQSGQIVQSAAGEVSVCASETVPSLWLNGVAKNAKDRVSKGSTVTHTFAHVSNHERTSPTPLQISFWALKKSHQKWPILPNTS